jgi:hypothetical protein
MWRIHDWNRPEIEVSTVAQMRRRPVDRVARAAAYPPRPGWPDRSRDFSATFRQCRAGP